MEESIESAVAKLRTLLPGNSEFTADFEGFLRRSEAPDFDAFLDEVDQSEYSLADWMGALLEFDRWLESRSIEKRPFRAMIGYAHCCTLISVPGAQLPSLELVVIQNLNAYGFEAEPGLQI